MSAPRSTSLSSESHPTPARVTWEPLVLPTADSPLLEQLRACVGAREWDRKRNWQQRWPAAIQVSQMPKQQQQVWRSFVVNGLATDKEHLKFGPTVSLVPQALADAILAHYGDAGLALLTSLPSLRVGLRGGDQTIDWVWAEVLRRRPSGVVWTWLCDWAATTHGWLPPMWRWGPGNETERPTLLDPTRGWPLPPKLGDDLRRESVFARLRLDQLPKDVRQRALDEAQYEGFQQALLEASPDLDPTTAGEWPLARWRQLLHLADKRTNTFGALLGSAAAVWLDTQHQKELQGSLRSDARHMTEEIAYAVLLTARGDARSQALQAIGRILGAPLPPLATANLGETVSLSSRLERMLTGQVVRLSAEETQQMLAAMPAPFDVAHARTATAAWDKGARRASLRKEHAREQAGLRLQGLALALDLWAWLQAGHPSPTIAERVRVHLEAAAAQADAAQDAQETSLMLKQSAVLHYVLQRLVATAEERKIQLQWPLDGAEIWVALLADHERALLTLGTDPESLPMPYRRTVALSLLAAPMGPEAIMRLDAGKRPTTLSRWGLTAEDRQALRPLLLSEAPEIRLLATQWLGEWSNTPRTLNRTERNPAEHVSPLSPPLSNDGFVATPAPAPRAADSDTREAPDLAQEPHPVESARGEAASPGSRPEKSEPDTRSRRATR